jgi:membrane-associated protease RseP (regulator of RpoE activity)
MLTVGMLIQALNLAFGRNAAMPKVWHDVAMWASPTAAIILMVWGVTIGPITEEVFFRGFLYNAIARRFALVTAVCAQALLFAILHPYEVVPFIGVFVLGVILAVIYQWRKTLLTPIFVHAMYNCVGLALVVAAALHNADAPMLGVFGSTSADGAIVSTVQPGSAAEKAGIRPGDVIVSYNGRRVTDFDRLVQLVRRGRIGETVRIQILRNGTLIEMKVTPRRRN